MPAIDMVAADPEARYGYSEQEYSPTLYIVSFSANGSTPQESAEDFALLRAAELAIEHGYRYFAVRDRLNLSTEYSYTTQNPPMPVTTCNKDGQCFTFYSPGGTSTFTTQLPAYANVIELYGDAPSADELFAYEADFVRRALRAKHGLESTR